jgi:glucokinase-like ROK family protein
MTKMKKSTQEETKIHNSRLVLSTIYNHGEISRVDISRLTELTRTTVSDVVNKFINDGLVAETGVSPSRGGKRAILLSLIKDSRHLIGIDLAESEFRGAVVNLRGEVVHRVHSPILERDGQAALALVYELIEKLLALTDRPILGIGIGTPGLMDPQKGIVRTAVNLDWFDLPLGDLLRERFRLPIYIANDSQVAALAEYIFDNPGKVANLALIKAGRGIGAGIVLNGKLFYGDNSGAGEIGHVQIVENGERCRCGNFGCLETVVSTQALVKRAKSIASIDHLSVLNRLVSKPDEITTETVLQAFEAGDPAIQALIDETGCNLGIAVSHLVGGLNINQIVIAGSLARFGDRLTQAIQAKVSQRSLPALAKDTKIVTSSLGKDVVILGAASLLLSHEFGLM